MNSTAGLPVERFLQTLGIVAREDKHLSYSLSSLFGKMIDTEWVRNLDKTPVAPNVWKLLCRDLDACKTQ